ncbi:MAG: TolC family protein [Acidobacteria bacterium]|nr:TolC family protein [Acidobacteriota bacterium]MCI0621232.1 TolC family protein [Acidobacteriota bacterium]MCI0718102.1 TolC family protein [Acidobacteriota bacterium]
MQISQTMRSKPTCILLILLFPATITFAQHPSHRVPFDLVGIDASKEKKLSLQEAVELALRNNRDIEVERLNIEISQLGVTGAEGRYDPIFSFGPSFTSRTLPVASILGGGANGAVAIDSATWNSSLQQLFRSGANLSLFFDNSRDTTNNVFTSLNPQFNSSLGFNFTQPLFRNFKIDPLRREIQIAKKQVSLSDAQFRLKVIETVTAVVQSYWDLAYAYSDLGVKQETADWAQNQLEINKRLAAAGTLAPVQIVEAEAELERREGDVLVAMENVNRAQNVLKQLVLPDRKDTWWSENFEPSDTADLKPNSLGLADAMQKALASRPELEQLNLQSELNAIDSAFNQNQVRPQVDLLASYISTGLAGTLLDQTNPFTAQNEIFLNRLNDLSRLAGLPVIQPLPPGSIPGNLIGGYGSSLSNLFEQNYRTFQVGVTLTLPLRNRTAEANLARTLTLGRQLQSLRQRVEQLVEADVRNALQAVVTAEKRVESARAGRVASQAQLESEERRFRAGEATNFFVLTRQNQLSEARSREMRTLADHNIATAQLQRAIASTLESFNIQLKK